MDRRIRGSTLTITTPLKCNNEYSEITSVKEALRKVASDGQARRNQLKKRSLQKVNEHFEADFNAAWPSAAVFQSFLGFKVKI